jgi:hypothetical protein
MAAAGALVVGAGSAGAHPAVGKFVEAGGSNYRGVGQKYILGSDRDRGLRIFKFNG